MGSITETSLDTPEQQNGRLLTYFIDDVSYGIEMPYITEIISMLPITEMPEMPAYLKGIINLRGKIIPVMDVRIRFGKEIRPYDDRTCIIVVNIEGVPVGLIVDSVSEVVAIPQDEITTVPNTSYGQTGNFIKNIGKTEKGIVLILDCEKLLGEQDFNEFSTATL